MDLEGRGSTLEREPGSHLCNRYKSSGGKTNVSKQSVTHQVLLQNNAKKKNVCRRKTTIFWISFSPLLLWCRCGSRPVKSPRCRRPSHIGTLWERAHSAVVPADGPPPDSNPAASSNRPGFQPRPDLSYLAWRPPDSVPRLQPHDRQSPHGGSRRAAAKPTDEREGYAVRMHRNRDGRGRRRRGTAECGRAGRGEPMSGG